MVAHDAPASVSLFLFLSQLRTRVRTRVRTTRTFARARGPFSPRRFTPTQDTLFYDPPARLILLVRGRGTEYLRDTETDSLQLYWPPPLLHLLPPPSSPGCRTAGWALRLTAAPTANQSAALPASRNRIPKIFPTFP